MCMHMCMHICMRMHMCTACALRLHCLKTSYAPGACALHEHCPCTAGEALATNRSLRRIDLRSNHCGDAGAFAFSEVSLKSVVKV